MRTWRALLSHIASTTSVRDRETMLETLGVENPAAVAGQVYQHRSELGRGRIPAELGTAVDRIRRNAPSIAEDLRSAERLARTVTGNPFGSPEITRQVAVSLAQGEPDSFVARSALAAIRNAASREAVEDWVEWGLDLASSFLPGGLVSTAYQAAVEGARAQGRAEITRGRQLAGTASAADVREADAEVRQAAIDGGVNIATGAAAGRVLEPRLGEYGADVIGNLAGWALNQGRRLIIRP